MKKQTKFLAILLLLSLFIFTGCTPYYNNFFAFGTAINLSLEKGKVNKTVREVNQEFEKLDKLFDTNIENSDLFKINNANKGEEIIISPDTYGLLELSKEVYEKSDGAFNIATFLLSEIWKLSPDTFILNSEAFSPPSSTVIEETLLNCDFDDIVLLGNNTVLKNNNKLKISFGALAKGYAGDKAYEIAIKNKNKGFIDVGGTIFICGDSYLNIGIGSPRETEFDFFGKVRLTGGSIMCTSGDYYRYYTHNSNRYHHIIGKNGFPSNSGVISATIISTDNKASGAMCDALSTAVVALGVKDGANLINQYGLSAVIITNENTYHLVNIDESMFTLKDTNYTKYV